MAESRELQLLLTLKDRATKQLGALQSKLKANEKAFKSMALASTTAFAGIATGVGVSVKASAEAEGSWAKFNTVFGDGADEMKSFIETLRKEMPTATDQIVRLASDMQDLLVPMGVARGEAQELSKGFLDVANKIGAFNDVAPTEVLEAIKSGLAGSSEPLRRFGINALESSLEARALKDGLLEAGQTFKDLDVETRNAIRAQALYAQVVDNSSDAINGFAENNDSFIRRSQELKATFRDLSVQLGNQFLPIIDDLLKKILPAIKAVGNWVEENPKLARTIIVVTGAVAGLVAITSALSLAFIAFNPVIAGIVVAIGALIAIGVALVHNWDKIKEKTKQVWESVASFFTDSWETISDAFETAIDFIVEKAQEFWDKFQSVIIAIAGFITGAYLPAMVKMTVATTVNIAKTIAQWTILQAKALASTTAIAIRAIPQVIASLARMTATMLTTTASFVAQWAVMGAKSVLHALKVAGAWLIALGPVGIILGVVTASALLIIKNWEWVKNMSLKIFNKLKESWIAVWRAIGNFFVNIANGIIGAFENMVNFIIDSLNTAINAVNKLLGALEKVGGDKIGISQLETLQKVELGRIGALDTPEITPVSEEVSRGSSGGTTVVNDFRGSLFGSDAGEEVGDMVIERLKLTNILG